MVDCLCVQDWGLVFVVRGNGTQLYDVPVAQFKSVPQLDVYLGVDKGKLSLAFKALRPVDQSTESAVRSPEVIVAMCVHACLDGSV